MYEDKGYVGTLYFPLNFAMNLKLVPQKIKFIKFIKSNHVLFSLESLAQRNKYLQATT